MLLFTFLIISCYLVSRIDKIDGLYFLPKFRTEQFKLANLFRLTNSFELTNKQSQIYNHKSNHFTDLPISDLISLDSSSRKYSINFNDSFLTKIKSYIRLTRAKNIFPTMILSLSGYLVTCNEKFIFKDIFLPMIVSILIMCNSMVINDLFDIEIDKINNPNRPLATGEITKNEATYLHFYLTAITLYISHFLSPFKTLISHIAMFITFIYTPYLKKIPVVKNLFCASLISFSIYFGSCPRLDSRLDSKLYSKLKNVNFFSSSLFPLIRFVFIGSLINEILLDIRDLEGDRMMGVNTIPTYIGKFASILLCQILFYSVFIWNTIYSFNISPFLILIHTLICFPTFVSFREVIRNNFSYQSIDDVSSKMPITLFLCSIYFIFLAHYPNLINLFFSLFKKIL